MPAYNQVAASQRMVWPPMDDLMSCLEEEEEQGPSYTDVQDPPRRFKLEPQFGSGAWVDKGDDPEVLPDAPPLVEEYVPFTGSNYESWQYYRYQEEATRELRWQQEQHQLRRPFVYTAPQPFAMPFHDWRSFR